MHHAARESTYTPKFADPLQGAGQRKGGDERTSKRTGLRGYPTRVEHLG
jgi:hypothetical protein